MGKVYEALFKAERQMQLEISQASIPAVMVQHWRSWPSHKIFSTRFALGVCLGLALCNMFILMLLFGILVLDNP